MTTGSIAARAVSSALTIIPTSPICALDAIYRNATQDVDALQRLSSDPANEENKICIQRDETSRWMTAQHIPVIVLYERPQDAQDVRVLLYWLAAALERIYGEAEPRSSLELDARAAMIAAENLNMVVPAMFGLEPLDDFGAMRDGFDRRYFSAQAEG